MRVSIVGGTGFVGGYLIEALLDRGHTPVVLVRPGSEDKLVRADECDVVVVERQRLAESLRSRCPAP